MEKEPYQFDITVKYGYNATHLKNAGYKIHTSIVDIFNVGITYINTQYGNVVQVYDMERTICDIIKNKNSIDIQVLNYALKQYVKSKNKRVPVLLEYAKKFRILEKVKLYLEMLL